MRSCARDQVLELLDRTQSIAYAVGVARRFVAEAVRQLDLVPHSDAKQSLAAMAEFIVARRF